MRPPTANAISQGRHGTYNAVDYRAKDSNNNWRKEIYAPCDMRISFYGSNGTAGKQIQAFDTAGRRHGFAHTESCSVAVGTNVKKGQLIGIMGYTGYTEPAGVNGTHLHWTIRETNGTYTYPPNLINEPFAQGGSEVANRTQVNNLYKAILHREGDEGGLNNYTGRDANQIVAEMLGSQEFRNHQNYLNAVTKQVQDLQTALANEQNKPPTVVEKEVEKIVEKIVKVEVPVEVIKTVEVEPSWLTKVRDFINNFLKKG